jgi:HSP20 family protein
MANLTRYDPFADLVDDFFKGFFVRPVRNDSAVGAPRMKVDVAEENGTFKVLAEIPGARKDEIRVSIDGDQVLITAELRREKEVKEAERLVHSERYYGKVSRGFRLGQDIDQSKAEAKYTDGVLELTLPKKSASNKSQLTIQ